MKTLLTLALSLTLAAGAHAQEDTTQEQPQQENMLLKVFPLVKAEQGPNHSDLEIGDVIVGELFEHERNGERTHTDIIEVPFFNLVEAESDGPDKHEFRVIDAPFTTVFESEQDGGRHETKILDLPLVSLVDAESDENGYVDTKVLSLPIIGPLFRHKRTDTEEKVRFLIFSHTTKRAPQQTAQLEE